MSTGINKINLAGANLTTNTAGAYWQNANIVVNTAGANLNTIIPIGLYYANTPSNCSILGNLNTGSNLTLVAANTVGLLWSDGSSVFANTTTNGTLVLVTVNSGFNVLGTFA
jgi:hypothetical protein